MLMDSFIDPPLQLVPDSVRCPDPSELQYFSAGDENTRHNVHYRSYAPFAHARDFVIQSATMIERAEYSYSTGRSIMDILHPYTNPDAAMDSSARDPPPKCHPGTRVHILEQLDEWLVNPSREHKMLWLYGPAGSGKSAVAQTFVELCAERDRLGATFFFSRPNHRDKPETVIPSLAYQLAFYCSEYKSIIAQTIMDDPHLLRKAMHVQFKRLIVEPFSRLQAERHASVRRPFLVVLDGLDECAGVRSQCELIKMISELVRLKRAFPIIWLLCSRPESHLKHAFSRVPECGRLVLLLDQGSREDVEHFLHDSFAAIRDENPDIVPPTWPAEDQMSTILSSRLRTFLLLLPLPSDTLKAHLPKSVGVHSPLAALDVFYTQTIAEVPNEVFPTTRRILMHLAFKLSYLAQYAQLSALAVCNLLQLDKSTFYDALRCLHSVIEVPSAQDAAQKQLRFFHASFHDFLLDSNRSGKFSLNPEETFATEMGTHLMWHQSDISVRYHAAGQYNRDSLRQRQRLGVLGALPILTWGPEPYIFEDITSYTAQTWFALGRWSQRAGKCDTVFNLLKNFDFRRSSRYGISNLVSWILTHYPSSGIVRTEPLDDYDLQLLNFLPIFSQVVDHEPIRPYTPSSVTKRRLGREYFLIGFKEKACLGLGAIYLNDEGIMKEELDILSTDYPPEEHLSVYWKFVERTLGLSVLQSTQAHRWTIKALDIVLRVNGPFGPGALCFLERVSVPSTTSMSFDSFIDRPFNRLHVSQSHSSTEYYSAGNQNAERKAQYKSYEPFKNAHEFVIQNATLIERAEYSYSTGRPALEILYPHTNPDAAMDSSARDPPPKCHPGTRVDTLEWLDNWLESPLRDHRMVWLYGPPGTGKSAIAQTFAETCAEKGRLGGAFFFSRPNHRDKPETVIPSLAYQLAFHCPAFKSAIAQTLIDDLQLFRKAMHVQFRRLIVEPLSRLQADGHESVHQPFLVVLDGLDECADTRAQCEIIKMISELVRLKRGFPVLWLLCSRPEAHLKHAFARTPECGRLELLLDEGSQKDVERYLRDSLATIKDENPDIVPFAWPSEDQVKIILHVASGLFVLASVAVRYIDDPAAMIANPVERLNTLVAYLKHTESIGITSPLGALDLIYLQILRDVPSEIFPSTRRILMHAAFRFSSDINTSGGPPLSTQATCNMLQFDQSIFYGALRRLHSVMEVPPPEEAAKRRLKFYHASFHDFLLDPSRSGSFALLPKDVFAAEIKTLIMWHQSDHSTHHHDVHLQQRPDSADLIQHQLGTSPPLTWSHPEDRKQLSEEISHFVYYRVWFSFGSGFALSKLPPSGDVLALIEECDFRRVANYGICELAEWIGLHYPSSNLVRTDASSDVDLQLLDYLKILNAIPGHEAVQAAKLPLIGWELNPDRSFHRDYFLIGRSQKACLVVRTTYENSDGWILDGDLFSANHPPNEEFWVSRRRFLESILDEKQVV
ncbi:hypothetical protein NP233_g5025 [Leucocoprinus birnbaumii]|uniref:NACHT domain-containing protein n=1 Tax=Leucocoprinus birnbaumii TaxID=56174 RepID=A0AAD5VWB9_9AGAR|nr:hypothetical protein NP233_g5025 [Leucocoprinus birnbaumii]